MLCKQFGVDSEPSTVEGGPQMLETLERRIIAPISFYARAANKFPARFEPDA
jgi:hypothetical protein